jgi:hypothetical protein
MVLGSYLNMLDFKVNFRIRKPSLFKFEQTDTQLENVGLKFGQNF